MRELPHMELVSLRKLDQETGRQMSALVKLNRKLSASHKLEDVLEALLDIYDMPGLRNGSLMYIRCAFTRS